MRPKNLKAPFSWKDRRVHLEERVWHVPEHYDKYDEFSFPGWHDNDFFGNDNPVHVEYCSGHGDWIINNAITCPDINWVAVERQFERVRKIWSKMRNLGIENLLIICGEGDNLTRQYFPDQSIEQAYVNFPDPWPKERHAKHRLIKPRFVCEMNRILKLNGKVTLVTDDPDYSKIMINEFSSGNGFISSYDDPFYMSDLEGYGDSFFESKWREQGKTIRHHQFQKV